MVWFRIIPFVFIFFTVSSWARPQLTTEEQQWLIDHPAITVGFHPSFPPLSFTRDGQPAGFLNEYFELVAREAGLHIEWKLYPDWKTLLNSGETGEVDVITAGVRTEERSQYFYFSHQVTKRFFRAFVKSRGTSTQPIDLSQGTFASPKSFFLTERLREDYPNLNVIETENLKQAFLMVASGEADYTITDQPVANYLTKQHDIRGIETAETVQSLLVYSRPLHILISRQHPELKSIISKAINQIPQEKILALQQTWINYKNAIDLSPEERAWVESAPTIRVQVSQDYMPFDFLKQDTPQGYSIELMQLLARMVGLELEFVKGNTWQQSIEMVKERKIDVVHTISKSQEREKFLIFSEVYFEGSPLVLYSRGDKNYISDISQLGEQRLAVESGAIQEIFLSENYPDLQYRPVSSIQDGINSVLKGESDYFLCEAIICDTFIYEGFISNIEASGSLNLGALDHGLPLRIATRSDWPILASVLQKALNSLSPEDVALLRRNWLPSSRKIQTPDSRLTENEKRWLESNNRWVYTTASDAAPYSYESNEDELVGYSNDLRRHVEKYLGVESFYKPAKSWPEAVNMLKEGQVDFIPWMYVTKNRRDEFLFSETYHNDPMMLYTRRDFRFVSGLEDLRGNTIAMLRDSAISEQLQVDFPDLNIVYYSSLLDIITAVSDGRADGLIQSAALVEHVLRTSDVDNLKLASSTPYHYQQAFAVHPSKPELIPLINKALSELSDTEQSLMLQKWTNIHVVERRNWTAIFIWMLVVVLGAALLAGIVIYRSRRAAFIEVKQSQLALTNAQRMAQLASWEWSASDDGMQWSEEGRHILNLMYGNRINRKGYVKLIHPDDRDEVASRWQRAMEDGVYQSEYRLLIDGNEKWVKDIAEMHTDNQGVVIGASGTTQDIDLQKNNELRIAQGAREFEELTGKLLSVQEEERRRVARELHDDLSQRLAALSIEAGTLEHNPNLESERERLSQLKQRLIQIATDVHGLSRRLHPSILDDLGLVDALRSEIESYELREHIKVHLHATAKLDNLSKDVQLTIFRVVQEALRNIAKYSEAGQVQVNLVKVNRELTLQVIDDGMGFDVDEAMKSPGLGLQSMTERAKLIGGTIEVKSEENKGTTIELNVSIP